MAEELDLAEVLGTYTEEDALRAAALDEALPGEHNRRDILLLAIARVVATTPFDQLDPDGLFSILDELKFNATELLGEIDGQGGFHGDEFTNLPEDDGVECWGLNSYEHLTNVCRHNYRCQECFRLTGEGQEEHAEDCATGYVLEGGRNEE